MKLVARLMMFVVVVLSYQSAMADSSESIASGELWLLAKYDTNGDQAISMSEVTYKRDKMFGYMDADADGVVSFDEYQGLDIRKRELLLKARYQKLDLDQDGQISSEEYRSYLGSFDRFDTDGDGRITAAEMAPTKVSAANEDQEGDTYCLFWLCVRSSFD